MLFSMVCSLSLWSLRSFAVIRIFGSFVGCDIVAIAHFDASLYRFVFVGTVLLLGILVCNVGTIPHCLVWLRSSWDLLSLSKYESVCFRRFKSFILHFLLFTVMLRRVFLLLSYSSHSCDGLSFRLFVSTLDRFVLSIAWLLILLGSAFTGLLDFLPAFDRDSVLIMFPWVVFAVLCSFYRCSPTPVLIFLVHQLVYTVFVIYSLFHS